MYVLQGTVSEKAVGELDLRAQNRHSLAYFPVNRGHFKITSFDSSPDSSDLIVMGGSDCFGRLYDRRMLRLGCTREKRATSYQLLLPKASFSSFQYLSTF